MRHTIVASNSDHKDKALFYSVGLLWRAGVDESEILKFIQRNGISSSSSAKKFLADFKRSKGYETSSSLTIDYGRFLVTGSSEQGDIEVYCNNTNISKILLRGLACARTFDCYDHRYI